MTTPNQQRGQNYPKSSSSSEWGARFFSPTHVCDYPNGAARNCTSSFCYFFFWGSRILMADRKQYGKSCRPFIISTLIINDTQGREPVEDSLFRFQTSFSICLLFDFREDICRHVNLTCSSKFWLTRLFSKKQVCLRLTSFPLCKVGLNILFFDSAPYNFDTFVFKSELLMTVFHYLYVR